MTDLGDKVSAEEKASVQAEIDKVKKALESDNTEEIKAATEELSKKFYEISQKLYQNANPEGSQGQQAAGEQPNDDGTYDADYTVDDEE